MATDQDGVADRQCQRTGGDAATLPQPPTANGLAGAATTRTIHPFLDDQLLPPQPVARASRENLAGSLGARNAGAADPVQATVDARDPWGLGPRPRPHTRIHAHMYTHTLMLHTRYTHTHTRHTQTTQHMYITQHATHVHMCKCVCGAAAMAASAGLWRSGGGAGRCMHGPQPGQAGRRCRSIGPRRLGRGPGKVGLERGLFRKFLRPSWNVALGTFADSFSSRA